MFSAWKFGGVKFKDCFDVLQFRTSPHMAKVEGHAPTRPALCVT